MKPQLDTVALREILDSALEMEDDGAGCGPYIGWNAGTILETLLWLEAEGHLDG